MDKYKFDYAIGIPAAITDIKSAVQSISRSSFQNIEIPGIWLESSDFSDNIDIANFNITGVTDLIAPSVSSSIADQKDNIINGFVEKLILLTDKLKPLRAGYFSLSTGVETVFHDQKQLDSRISLLKKIAPCLYRKNLNLCIPVRLPSVITVTNGKYASFLKNTMCGNIKLGINIHPHETAKLDNPAELLNEYRFFIGTVSFIYEPESGNNIVEKLLGPWFKALDELDYKGTIIFRPRVSNIDSLIKSLDNISKLLRQCK